MMHRTTIMLPNELKHRAERRARQEGLSLAQVIRQALEKGLNADRGEREQDPFFADHETFAGGPSDMAENHDKYLNEILLDDLRRSGHFKDKRP